MNMFIYNAQTNKNPFGFAYKSCKLGESASNRSRAVKQASTANESIGRLSKENIEFLRSLGFEVEV